MKLFCVIIFASLIMGCSPVNLTTRVKKYPREYSMNYCGGTIKAPASVLNQSAWVVYSDRDKSMTMYKPGGREKCQDLNFLDPFLVIDHRGEYLELIRYQPDLVKDGKLVNRKKAEYCGWIHQSRLLLTSTGITDLKSGIKNKSVTTIRDTIPLMHPEEFFVSDSLKVYKDPGLAMVSEQKLPLNELVYIMKVSNDRRHLLVSRKSDVKPDDISAEVMGWVHASVVQPYGQKLFVVDGADSLRNNELTRPLLLNYLPVNLFEQTDSLVTIATMCNRVLVDKSENYIYNVKGQPVRYDQTLQMADDLKHVNVMFVFEPGEKGIQQFPALVNLFQNMQAGFTRQGDNFDLRFGSLVALSDDRGGLTYHTSPLDRDYSKVLDNLIEQSGKINSTHAISSFQAWKGLRGAMEQLLPDARHTNVVILMGEQGRPLEEVDSVFVRLLAMNNCRLMGGQIFAGLENSSNNFVLQLTQMVQQASQMGADDKKNRLVYGHQIKNENVFVEKSKNHFMLDYPNRSMFQGGLMFPEKGKLLNLEQFKESIDSFLVQVKDDNMQVIQSLQKAYASVGNNKDKLDSLFRRTYNLTQQQLMSRELKKSFTQTLPYWMYPQSRYEIDQEDVTYRLLLTGNELEALLFLLEQLSSRELERVELTENQMRIRNNICDCETYDRIYAQPIAGEHLGGRQTYSPTGSVRRHLKRTLVNEVQNAGRTKWFQSIGNMTLAQAHEAITLVPVKTPLLKRYKVKELTRVRFLTNAKLDEIIQYYKQKKNDFLAGIDQGGKFVSNGHQYYWIQQEMLP
ncbi:MAG: hypothetical protein JXR39_01295 [Marinilabiliaceae bacterium]|nr:hypothetical protein [Marinilabiliaceae bacterium]